MSRVSAALASAFAAGAVSMIALVRMEFDSGTLRLWTGQGSLSWNSETWTGVGGVISKLELPTETAEVKSAGGQVVFNGLDPSILALADTEPYQGRPVSIYFGARDASGNVIVDPDLAYEGTIDTMQPVDEGETASVAVSVESRSVQNERAANRRLTPEDLALEYDGDKGFDFVAVLQNSELRWGPS